ncbi:uncharacterized protein [Haliotis cracherodii]|uniref:uncharacterized protein n=1 Tax=Haliotis cracherodii TaxID=6455 RepID=UPI0039EA2712
MFLAGLVVLCLTTVSYAHKVCPSVDDDGHHLTITCPGECCGELHSRHCCSNSSNHVAWTIGVALGVAILILVAAGIVHCCVFFSGKPKRGRGPPVRIHNLGHAYAGPLTSAIFFSPPTCTAHPPPPYSVSAAETYTYTGAASLLQTTSSPPSYEQCMTTHQPQETRVQLYVKE